MKQQFTSVFAVKPQLLKLRFFNRMAIGMSSFRYLGENRK